jgi:iron complex transport system permease protein
MKHYKHHIRTPLVLGILLVFILLVGMRYGAVDISLHDIFSSIPKRFLHPDELSLNERIFLDIRMPRAILSLFVGASLAVGGVLMQALFRNPIVEPGLVGTSSGAAFGSALYFVLGSLFKFNAGEWTLPLAAVGGAILSTLMVFTFAPAGQSGKSSITTLLLTGLAINALFLSGVGFLSYIARDPQARSIIFWNLGTLSGANWHSVTLVGITTIICIFMGLNDAKHLNALMIGEEDAQFLGVNVRKLKFRVMTINIIMVAIATAFVGVISFVGLIVPHLLRMLVGSDNRYLIINSVLLGGILLGSADLISRMMVRPAELPIGIVTSVVGVPVFIFLLRKKNYFF